MRKEDRVRQQQREGGPGSQPRPESRPQEQIKGRDGRDPEPRTPKPRGKIPLPD